MEQLFALPGGYVDADGVIQKEVVLTPVTGRVRKEMGKAESRRRGHSLINAILSKCIKRIGDVTNIHDGVLDKMSSGDRSFCLMMIRRFRNEAILSEERCNCGVTNLYEVQIDDYARHAEKAGGVFFYHMVWGLCWPEANCPIGYILPRGDWEIRHNR